MSTKKREDNWQLNSLKPFRKRNREHCRLAGSAIKITIILRGKERIKELSTRKKIVNT